MNKHKKGKLLQLLLCMVLVLSGCTADKEKSGQTIPEEQNEGSSQTAGETKVIRDKDTLYRNHDRSAVVTMYLTVSSGNASDNTDHTWREVNSYSIPDYESMGVERYGVNGLLQVGDENGPSEGELGYGQSAPNATVTIRGQSSSSNAQKNYKISIRDGKGTWNDQKVINLNKHQSDATRFSNKLCYDLMTELPGMIAMRTQFVHLYVKDETAGGSGAFEDYGLYTQVEQLNKRALQSHGLDKNGQLYKVNFFEFYRYEDVIMLKSDADYDAEVFEEYLEIKGDDDHSKLIAMLEDVNDYSIPIEETVENWFESDNVISWLAFHMLMGNADTQSRNVFLYSPLNSRTWYFLSWDNDGSFTDSKLQYRGRTERGWEKGISNYWGNVLFRRIFKSESLRAVLEEKIQEYRSVITEEKLTSMVAQYAAVVENYAFAFPDSEHMPVTQSQYEQLMTELPEEVEKNYEHYVESLKEPMPFFIGIPETDGQKTSFVWENAYDFNEENILYTFELAEDYSFEHPIIYEENIFLPGYEYEGTLPAGQYFMRVTAANESGRRQGAFDYYVNSDSVKIYGTKCFFVTADGSIQEDAYEE